VGEWITVGSADEVPEGEATPFAVGDAEIAVARSNGTLYAFSDICGHRNAPLSRGTLSGHVVECPLHFAQFDVRTGKLVDGPVSADVASYETRVEGDTVFVKR